MTCSRLGVAGLGQETGGEGGLWDDVEILDTDSLTGRSKCRVSWGFAFCLVQLPLDFSFLCRADSEEEETKPKVAKLYKNWQGPHILLFLGIPAPDAQYWSLAHLPPSRSHDAKSSRPMIAGGGLWPK